MLVRMHAEMFPCHRMLSSDVVKQLKKVMNFGLYGERCFTSCKLSMLLVNGLSTSASA